jgi:hypothetical protein
MLFPLDYTVTDVEDILPPGNYLLDVVDKSGEPLGVTVGLSTVRSPPMPYAKSLLMARPSPTPSLVRV